MSKRHKPQPQRSARREILIEEGTDYRIFYCFNTRDFTVEFAGQLVGWRPTQTEARRLADQMRTERKANSGN